MRRLIERLTPWPRRHRIGRYTLRLTRDHPLPRFLAAFPGYDRFLPHLARTLPEGASAIDIGANLGDTVAALADANPGLRLLAVEPAAAFLPLLRANIAAMAAETPALSVEIVEAYVTAGPPPSGLAAARGTAHAVAGGGGAGPATLTLDALAARALSEVALVKSDTDGHDWSVLASGPRLLAEIRPDLFFECEVGTDPAAPARYGDRLRALRAAGYAAFHLFDNYGGHLCRIADPAPVEEILAYVVRQNAGRAARSLWYLDILAVRPEREAAARAALAAFEAEIAGRG